MITLKGFHDEYEHPYGPKGHVWERKPDGSFMDGIVTKEQWKKKYGFLAKYECMECKHRFESKPGPLCCFKCGYKYIRWLNWKKCIKAIHK